MENIEIDKLIPYEQNPRHNDDAVSAVAESIKQFGFKVPIVVDKGLTIVAGHTRWKAAKLLGMTSVPCIIADDLTESQIKAFRLADNRVGEIAKWDFSKLESELSQLKDFNMEAFGFEAMEDIDIDSFFEESTKREVETEPEKDEPKKVQCPHCGEWFEL